LPRGGWETLLKHLNKTKADDEPLTILEVLDSNGLDDALWCLQAVDTHESELRLFAVWCARQVQHLMTDERSIKALDVAEAYARGEATKGELNDTAKAACAAYAACAATYAARAAYATRAAAVGAKATQEAKFRSILEDIKNEGK